MHAVLSNSIILVKAVLKKNPDLSIKTEYGETALEFAKINENNEIIKLLEDYSIIYHPLLPIYILLLSFKRQFSPEGNEFNEDPFFDTYILYIDILEKITDVISLKYLSQSASSSKIIW
jgi:ankyrin repeat protein